MNKLKYKIGDTVILINLYKDSAHRTSSYYKDIVGNKFKLNSIEYDPNLKGRYSVTLELLENICNNAKGSIIYSRGAKIKFADDN